MCQSLLLKVKYQVYHKPPKNDAHVVHFTSGVNANWRNLSKTLKYDICDKLGQIAFYQKPAAVKISLCRMRLAS